MKKLTFFLFFIALFSFTSFAQTDNDEQTDEVTTTQSVFTPMNTNTAVTRCPHCYKYHSPHCVYCNVCRCYHYPVCPTPTPTPHPLPFDGGLSVLLVAGAAYGAKKRLAKKEPGATTV